MLTELYQKNEGRLQRKTRKKYQNLVSNIEIFLKKKKKTTINMIVNNFLKFSLSASGYSTKHFVLIFFIYRLALGIWENSKISIKNLVPLKKFFYWLRQDALGYSIYYYCAPFIKCLAKIDGKKVDDAEDLNLVMPIYNLLEFSWIYSDTTGSFWFYSKDEAAISDASIVRNIHFKSF